MLSPFSRLLPYLSNSLRGGSRIQHFTLQQDFDRVSGDRFRQNSSSKVAGFFFVLRDLCRGLQSAAVPNFRRIPPMFDFILKESRSQELQQLLTSPDLLLCILVQKVTDIRRSPDGIGR